MNEEPKPTRRQRLDKKRADWEARKQSHTRLTDEVPLIGGESSIPFEKLSTQWVQYIVGINTDPNNVHVRDSVAWQTKDGKTLFALITGVTPIGIINVGAYAFKKNVIVKISCPKTLGHI